MKNQVIDILEDINPGVDYEARVDLVDSRCIDSKMHSTSRYPPSRSYPTISTRLRPYAP